MFTVTFVVVPFLLATWSVAISVSATCVSNYDDFVEHSFGNNSENRQRLSQAFYPPNGHLPYSVLVTYQTVLPNGTVLSISTDPSCTDEQVWMWLSSPLFLYEEPSSLNRHVLYALNSFKEWIPPHIYITCPYPCQNKAEKILQEMTTSLQSHALGMIDGQEVNGVFVKYCSSVNFVFDSEIRAAVAVMGFITLGIFISLAPILLQDFVQNYILPGIEEEEAPTYTYKIFWGISASSFLFDTVVLCSDINTFMTVFRDIGPIQQCLWGFGIPFVLLLCMASSIYCASSYKLIAIPDVYLSPMQYFSCKKKGARLVVTSFTICFILVGVQLLIHHGIMILHAMQIAPVTIFKNVMLLALVGTCVMLINVATFTDFARLSIRRHFPVVFLLIAVSSFGGLIVYNTRYGKVAMENVSYLILLQGIFWTILLRGVSLVIDMFMHWLNEPRGMLRTAVKSLNMHGRMYCRRQDNASKVVRALFSDIENNSSSKSLSGKLYQCKVINFQCLQKIRGASSDMEANGVLAEHLQDGTKETLQGFAQILIESGLPRQKDLGEQIKAALTDQESLPPAFHDRPPQESPHAHTPAAEGEGESDQRLQN